MADLPNVSCFPLEKSKEWRILDGPRASGNYGTIWEACSHQGCGYVMKVNKYTSKYSKQTFLKEMNMQKALAGLCLGLPIEDWWECETAGVLIMPAMDMTLKHFITMGLTQEDYYNIKTVVRAMMEKIHHSGYYHGDSHFENLMVRKVVERDSCSPKIDTSLGLYEILFIDMGLAGRLDRPGYKGRKPVTKEQRIKDDLAMIDSEIRTSDPFR